MTPWKRLRAVLRAPEQKVDVPVPVPVLPYPERPSDEEILLAQIECNGFTDPCDYQMAISVYLGYISSFYHGGEARIQAERNRPFGRLIEPGEPYMPAKPGKVLIRKRRSLNDSERKAVEIAEVLEIKLPKVLRKRAAGKVYSYTNVKNVPPSRLIYNEVSKRGEGKGKIVAEYVERRGS